MRGSRNSRSGRGDQWPADRSDDPQDPDVVDAGSPIEEAGAVRGDILLAINGRDPNDFIVEGHWDPRVWGEWSTAPWGAYAERDGQRIGCLEVAGFDDTTADSIDFQLAWLAEQGVTDLVLDLRYTGGGRTWVARRLAAQIAGTDVEGEVYARYVANDKYPEFEYADTFEVPELTLPFPRVVMLVADSTASASEALTNGLEPYVDVTVVGMRTLGKPFASVGVDCCERTLLAMRWESENAAGVPVADGIEPDCEVEDAFVDPGSLCRSLRIDRLRYNIPRTFTRDHDG